MNACRILAVVSAATALAAGAASAQGAAAVPTPAEEAPAAAGVREMAGTVCPVLGGPIDKKIYADYKGTRYYFCCVGCQGKFKVDPEKYVGRAPGE